MDPAVCLMDLSIDGLYGAIGLPYVGASAGGSVSMLSRSWVGLVELRM